MAVQPMDRVHVEIVRLLTSSDAGEIEAVADDLGRLGDRRAIGPLVSMLADSRVNDDPDVEDAVCASLVLLGAMECRGNLNYSFVEPSRLNAECDDALRRMNPVIPRRYFRGI